MKQAPPTTAIVAAGILTFGIAATNLPGQTSHPALNGLIKKGILTEHVHAMVDRDAFDGTAHIVAGRFALDF